MKRARVKRPPAKLAAALTWDGARWPVRALPVRARAFLAGEGSVVLSPRAAADRFAADGVAELRICWVPRFQGGEATLADPFTTPEGLRLAFAPTRMMRFGDILGVVYRRSPI